MCREQTVIDKKKVFLPIGKQHSLKNRQIDASGIAFFFLGLWPDTPGPFTIIIKGTTMEEPKTTRDCSALRQNSIAVALPGMAVAVSISPEKFSNV